MKSFDEMEDEFDWTEYLAATNSEAAPASCFCQNSPPPVNEFRVGNKLETYDPRNTSSTCIGTVIETHGSRIRLRLDGTDDRNDFWMNVDSDLIHPFEYSAKLGKCIQPPLGFGNDLSKWPKFLEKIIQTAEENVFAGESCFKTPPTRPPRNEFKVGQKLEAVDPKNPHLICPATVREVKLDKLLLTFDGWSASSQFWCPYNSRDIFPIGWCKQTGHNLQLPGGLEDKKISNNSQNASKNQSLANGTLSKNTSAATKAFQNKSQKQKETDRINKSADSSLSSIRNDVSTENDETIDQQKHQKRSSRLSSANTNTIETKHQIQLTTPVSTQAQASKVAATTSETTATTTPKLDLSIIKSEAMDVDSLTIPSSDPLASIINQENNKMKVANGHGETKNSKKKFTPITTVFVNPTADCGKLIKTPRFHTAHTKFGPGSPSNVYKSILQSFVDCAFDRLYVFNLIPRGQSADLVKLRTPVVNEKRQIVATNNVEELWSNLREFCEILEINADDVFMRAPTPKSHYNGTALKVKQVQPVDFSTPILNSENAASMVTSSASLNSKKVKKLKKKVTKQPLEQITTTTMTNGMSQGGVMTPTSSENSVATTITSNGHDMVNGVQHGQKRHLNGMDSLVNGTSNGYQNDTNGTLDQPSTNKKLFKYDLHSDVVLADDWSIDEVIEYLRQIGDSYFSSHLDMFRLQEIDGKAFLLLTTEILMKYMGFKLGPALKLNNYIDKLRRISLQKNSTINENMMTPHKVE